MIEHKPEAEKKLHSLSPNDTYQLDTETKTFSLYIIFPPLFLLTIAYVMSALPLRQWVLDQICQAVNNGQSPNGFPGMTSFGSVVASGNGSITCDDKSVLVAEGNWSTLFMMLTSIPSTVMAPIYGILSDYLGRKPNLLLSSCAFMTTTTGILLVIYHDMGLWPLIFFKAIEGLLGSLHILVLTGFSFMSDTSSEQNRQFAFIMFDIVLNLAAGGGSILGTYLVEKVSVITFFLLVLSVQVVSLIYIIICVPETLSSKQRRDGQPDRKDTISFISMVKQAFSDIKRVLKKMLQPSLLLIFSVSVLITSAEIGQVPLFFAFSKIYWGWNDVELGEFFAQTTVVSITTMLVLAPLLSRLFSGPSVSPIEKLRYELNLVRISTLFLITAQMLYAFATRSFFWNIAVVFEGSASLADPTLKAILSRSMSIHDQGKLFASLEFVSGFTRFLATSTFQGIFTATTKGTHVFIPATMISVACVYFVSLLLCLLVRGSRLIELIDRQVTTMGDMEDETTL